MAATVAVFLLVTLFINLALWQTKRAEEKAETEQQYRSATTVLFAIALAEKKRFAHIDVNGHYDPVRHILLDNQIWNGRSGVHVFTPFYTLDGATILVNRGWLPLVPDRHTMPEIPTPEDQIVLSGRLNTLPVPGRILGEADKLNPDRWPQLVTYLNYEDIGKLLAAPLENWVIQLSDSEQTGFEGRDWKPVFMSSSRHKAYAFQWYALSMTGFVLWIMSGFKKTLGNKK